jgi:hypothetical protein
MDGAADPVLLTASSRRRERRQRRALTETATFDRGQRMPMAKPQNLKGLPLDQKFDDLFAAAALCFKNGHTTPGLVLIYSGMDVAAWIWCVNPAGPVKQRFVHWVDRYMKPKETLRCSALELYSARCATVHNFGSESEMTRKGEARNFLYALPPSDISLLHGPHLDSIGYVGIDIGVLVSTFSRGLKAMFVEANENAQLLNRLEERQRKVLQTISDSDGMAMFDWGNRLVTVVKAPAAELLDLDSVADCETANNCNKPATVLIRGLDELNRTLAEVTSCNEHAATMNLRRRIDRRA